MEKIRCKKGSVIFIMLFMAIYMVGFNIPQQNSDGIFVQTATDTLNEDIYFVDTIEIVNPIILIDRKGGYNFIKSGTIDELKGISKKNAKDILCQGWTICITDLSDPIIIWNMKYFSGRFIECLTKYSMYHPFSLKTIDNGDLKNWKTQEFENEPDKYFLFMVKGKAFNQYTYNIWAEKFYDYKIDFPAENLYYPIVVPVTRK